MKLLPLLLLLIFNHYLFASNIETAKELFDKKEQYKEAIEIFKKFNQDGEALYYLGKAYLYGMGVEKDEFKAFDYAKQSASKNNPSGLNLLGVVYQYGQGIEKDELQALMYYKQAAELGNTKAMINLASMYANVDSNIIQINNDESIKWLKRAIELNNIDAIRILGNVLGSNQVAKHEEAIIYHKKYLELISTDNDKYTDVLWHLSRSYQKLNKHDIAYDYLKQAVNLGDTWAIESIVYFENPNIIPKDELVYWMKQGVEKKITSVYLPLSLFYKEEEDSENLKPFLEKAYYVEGNVEMGCDLASSYSSSPFFEINHEKAYSIASKIIFENEPSKATEACYSTLSYLYLHGYSVAKDLHKSIELLKIVFYDINKEKNYLFSERIASYYLNALQDFQNAQKWYQITCDLTKDEKYLSMVEEYKKTLPAFESKPKAFEQQVFPIIDSFTKKEQVVSVLESEEYYFLSTDVKSIKIYDKKSLQLFNELRSWVDSGISGMAMQMAFDEEKKLLYVSFLDSSTDFSKNDIIKIFDINSGKIVKTLDNKKAMKNTYLNISEDGKYLVAINNENLLNIINTATNEIQFYNLSNEAKFSQANIAKIEDNYFINLLSKDNHLYTFSFSEKRRVKKEPFYGQTKFKNFNGNHAEKIFSQKSSANLTQAFLDEKYLVMDFNDNQRKVFNLENFSFDSSHQIVNEKSISHIKIVPKHDNKILEVYGKDSKLLSELSLLYVKAVKYITIDDKYIAVTTSDVSNMLVFTIDGIPIANLQGFKSYQTNLSYSNGILTSFGSDNIVNLFNLKDLDTYAKKEKKYNEETLQGFSKIYGGNGNPLELLEKAKDKELEYFITSMIDSGQLSIGFRPTIEQIKNSMNILMLEKQIIYPIASLYIKNKKDWILYNHKGLFAYGGDGKNLIKYHQNQGFDKEAKIVENEKLFEKFYRPDLLKKIVAGEKVDFDVDVKSVLLNIKPPLLEIIEHKLVDDKNLNLTYKICDAGNGVKTPTILINDASVNIQSARGFKIEKIQTQESKCKLYKNTLTLKPGNNTISIQAYDEHKNIAAKSDAIQVTANYQDKTEPNLYFLSIAVSEYEDKNLRLKYPVNDAKSVKKEIKEKGKTLYENIYTYELLDGKVSKENIAKTFDEISKRIGINDVFVLYIAGHGVTQDGLYQFLPFEKNETISIATLKENLSKIYTDKYLVLLDTCQSEAAMENSFDNATTLARLSHDHNRNYIVASSKDQAALEGIDEHGIFTYSVLDAFAKNSKLKVYSLASHIEELVPRLSQEKFHFKQTAKSKLNEDFILIDTNSNTKD